MKVTVIIVLGVMLATFMARAEEEGVHLFILSGQSNMAGLKPETSFTPGVEKEFGAEKVLVVKDAQGGQPIRRWHKKWSSPTGKGPESTGDLYDRLMEKVRPAIEGKSIETVTFVWMQGERDAKESFGEIYGDSLRGLLQQLEQDLRRTDIDFVIGRLSDFDMANERYPHWTKIREVQVQVAEADPSAEWVDTDDLNDPSNGLHYSKDGYTQLGARFAEKAIALIKKRVAGG